MVAGDEKLKVRQEGEKVLPHKPRRYGVAAGHRFNP
jgi:hypothetical protein